MSAQAIEIRACKNLEDFERCVQLQIAVWGHSESELVPRKIFLLARKIGGQVFGAFLSGRESDLSESEASSSSTTGPLVGFAMALPGYRSGHAYLHSHMLAVLPAYRDSGLGRRLKLAQREDALARGIHLIEWTFDPLQIKNAYLNIERLGAVARRYSPDFYGPSSSPLQGGLPTDRLHAEWWLSSRRVESALKGTAPSATPGHSAGQETENNQEAENNRETENIVVPGAVASAKTEPDRWKQSPREQAAALEIQSRNRQSFQSCFAKGLSVLRFRRDSEGNGVYTLGRWDEDFGY